MQQKIKTSQYTENYYKYASQFHLMFKTFSVQSYKFVLFLSVYGCLYIIVFLYILEFQNKP